MIRWAYNSSLKANVMFWCIRAASLGMNLISSGITTSWYQSSTLVTSNVAASGTTDMFCGWYMSESSARVQLSRNWVRVVLLISATFLWRNTAVQERLHLTGWIHVSEMSVWGLCAHVPFEWRTQTHERSSQWVWKPPWTRLQPVDVTQQVHK